MGLKLVLNYLILLIMKSYQEQISKVTNLGKFCNCVDELAPINKSLIKKEKIFKKIDEWHKQKRGIELDKEEYKNF